MRNPIRLIFVAIALAAIVGVAAVAAQGPAAGQPGRFGEIVDVRVVNLEVVVTDADGVPIRGLNAEQFQLLVDGEEVPIDFFSEVLGGRTVRPVEGAEDAAVPELQQVEPGGRVGTSYLLFIDNFFSLPTDRNRVLRAFEESLFLGPEDRMAIVSFDGRNLEMLTTWSQDDVELRRVLRKSLADPAYGLQRLSERRQFDYERVLDVSSALLSDSLDIEAGVRNYLDPNERHHVTRLSEQVERSVAAASATLRSFAKPPGRKVMVLLNGGWPLLPAEFVLNDVSRYVIDREILAGEPLFRPLIDTANLLGYTIYPVDVPGLAATAISAELSAAPSIDSFGSSALGNSFTRESSVHAALHYLARQTGGRAMINAQRMRAFETVVQDTRSYYWLGFSPARDWDNRRHDVEIKTRNPGLRLRARQGFLDSSRGREVSMAVESALLFGGPTGDDLLKVEFGEAEPAGRGKIAVPIEILVPLDQLTFLPTAEGLEASTELRLGLIDDDGGRSEIPVIPVTFQTAAAPASGHYGRYETTIKMRREHHRAVVAIYDLAGGRILSAAADLDY